MDPYLQTAIDEARTALAEGFIGSVLVRGGQVIGRTGQVAHSGFQ